MITPPIRGVNGLSKIDETKNSTEPNGKRIRPCLV